jgi:hypothetical protein
LNRRRCRIKLGFGRSNRRGVKQENPMSELNGATQNEQSVLIFEVSDETIESAAGSVWGRSAAVTLAFCSGLDTCPSVQA